MLKRILAVLIFTLTLCAPALSQYVTLTGTLQSSNGLPASNYGISFTLSQFGYISGTGVVVNTTTACATSVDGSVVGLPNPLQQPGVTTGFTGTLPPANYYVVLAFYDAAGHLTLISPERVIQLISTGRIIVNAPVSGLPAGAVGMKVYISTSTGTETLQGTTTGSASWIQSIPLVTGASPSSSNTTICKQIANDAIWPTGTGYTVAMTDPGGNTIPGYPMQWQLMGPNGTINLSNGLPYYNGTVYFPTPILASPLNHALQSISGPLSLSGYNLVNVGAVGVGTTFPAWPVDVENGAINASAGFIYNGGTGVATGNCLVAGSDPYKTFIPSSSCLTEATAFYQTVAISSSAKPQEPEINFIAGPNVILTSTDTPGVSTNLTINLSPASTHTPTIAFTSPADGTLGAMSNDLAGFVNVTMAGNGGTLFTITFTGTYSTPVFCVVSTNGGFASEIFDETAGSTTFNQVSSTAATTSGTGIVNYLCHQ